MKTLSPDNLDKLNNLVAEMTDLVNLVNDEHDKFTGTPPADTGKYNLFAVNNATGERIPLNHTPMTYAQAQNNSTRFTHYPQRTILIEAAQ